MSVVKFDNEKRALLRAVQRGGKYLENHSDIWDQEDLTLLNHHLTEVRVKADAFLATLPEDQQTGKMPPLQLMVAGLSEHDLGTVIKYIQERGRITKSELVRLVEMEELLYEQETELMFIIQRIEELDLPDPDMSGPVLKVIHDKQRAQEESA